MYKNIKNIDNCNNTGIYNYKNVNFLYKKNLNKSCLVVFLHGKTTPNNTPVYRGYNYKFKNSSDYVYQMDYDNIIVKNIVGIYLQKNTIMKRYT